MNSNWIFDQAHYQALNAAREPMVRQLASEFRSMLGSVAPTAIDVGCGVGYYTDVLDSLGFRVLGVDARRDNIDEARKRYPHLQFQIADAEDPKLGDFGKFDLVFCIGLFYHLENPFRLIRSFSSMASHVVLLEGICYPSHEPALVLLDEMESNDQGVNAVAYYPSEVALVKMLHSSGFSECYLLKLAPAHPDYREDSDGFRKRTVLIAAKSSLELESLKRWPGVISHIHAWDPLPPLFPLAGLKDRARGLLREVMRRQRIWRNSSS